MPLLLRRIGVEIIGDVIVEPLRPIRQPRSRLIANTQDGLVKAVTLATRKLKEFDEDPSWSRMVLLLLDADQDCAKQLVPGLFSCCQPHVHDVKLSVVFAVVEFESWFVAAVESLSSYLEVSGELALSPEATRSGKKWVADRFRGTRYSETVDQPRMTASMDLHLCRQRSPSFDKLCRDVEKAIS